MAVICGGRYEGHFESFGLAVIVRVDRGPDGRLHNVSGDLFAEARFILSFYAQRGRLSESTDGRLSGQVTYFANSPLPLAGSEIELTSTHSDTSEALLTIDLGAGNASTTVRLIGPELRTLLVETDGIAGLPEPEMTLFSGDPDGQDVTTALARASIAATVRTTPFRPDRSARPRHTLAELHALMTDWNPPKDGIKHAWRVHALFANRFDGRNGDNVSGVMYDVEPGMSPPRQGLAIFLNSSTIGACQPNGPDWRREVLFALVHEIGHALNLPHCFEDRRIDALTWMNYPENVSSDGGFWSRFSGLFDQPELDFLRHAPFADIAPGQYAFARRDSNFLSGGSIPQLLRPIPQSARPPVHAKFSIAPLKTIYGFGEPIFLKVTITNLRRKPLRIAKALDPSDGHVSIQIRTPSGKERVYRSPAALCQRSLSVTIGHNKSISFDGILASFDADGPLFDEPGRYSITASYNGILDQVLLAKPTYLRVLYPTKAEELFAISIWDDPQLMRAIYCRQPLLALDSWQRLMDEQIATLELDRNNTTRAYFNYLAAMGWLAPFAPASRTKKYHPKTNKASVRLREIDTRFLPDGVRRKKREHGKASKS